MKRIRSYGILVMIVVLLLSLIVSGCGSKQDSKSSSAENATEKKDFPTKEIKQLVPFAAGGGFDVQARKVGEELNKILGVPIVTEDLPGAGSALALVELKKAKPDGYTLAHIHSESNPIQQVIFGAPYDVRDLTYLGGIRTVNYLLMVAKDSPIQELDDFKSKDRIKFGAAGTGQPSEIAALTLGEALGKEITTIPYDGNGPSVAGLLAGEVDFILGSDSTYASNKDTVRLITILSDERHPVLKDVATITELGYPDVYKPVTIQGYVGPKGMDDAVVKILVDAIKKAMNGEGLKKWSQKTGADIRYSPPEELKKKTLEMLDSAEKYRKVFE